MEIKTYDYDGMSPVVSVVSVLGMSRNTDPATSHEAAGKLTQYLSTIQAEVLSWFRSVSNGTDAELEDALKHKYPGFSTLRKRRSELVQKGLLRKTNSVRKNRNGFNMTVWTLAGTD